MDYASNPDQPPKPDASKTPEQQAQDYQAWVLKTLLGTVSKAFDKAPSSFINTLPSHENQNRPDNSRFN
jgi:hypothetical protein